MGSLNTIPNYWRWSLVPRVGKTHYPYTKKGKAAAKKAAKRTGTKVTTKKRGSY